MFIDAGTLNGSSQYRLPVAGSSEYTPSAPFQIISWRTPPALTRIGWDTPGSDDDSNDRHSSSPVSLSNATTSASPFSAFHFHPPVAKAASQSLSVALGMSDISPGDGVVSNSVVSSA